MTEAMAEEPRDSLTIAVIVLVGGAALEDCLRSVGKLSARCMVIGPRRHLQGLSQHGREFDIRYSDAPVPERRAHAVEAATTEWVALLEDTCALTDGWYDAFREVTESGVGAAWGGPVRIAAELPSRCVALGCVEYGEYAPDHWEYLAQGAAIGRARRSARIPGACLLYRRQVVAPLLVPGGLVEPDLHAALQSRGDAACMHPGLEVTYAAADVRGATGAARFAHGRIYGGGMAARSNWVRRASGVVKCLLLPPVLARRAAAGLPAGHAGRPVACCWIGWFAIAWTAGELVGLLCGRARDHRAWA